MPPLYSTQWVPQICCTQLKYLSTPLYSREVLGSSLSSHRQSYIGLVSISRFNNKQTKSTGKSHFGVSVRWKTLLNHNKQHNYESLKTKDEESTRLTYTGILGEVELLKMKTRLMDVTITHDQFRRTTQRTNGVHTQGVSSSGVPQSDGVLNDTVRIKIRTSLSSDWHEPIVLTPIDSPNRPSLHEVDDEVYLLFWSIHQIFHKLPSQLQSRVGLNLTKTTDLRITFNLDGVTSHLNHTLFSF
jgi:hypothetical protein